MGTHTYNNLREMYLHSIREFANNKCFSLFGREEYTYAQFSQKVDELAKMFHEAGLVPGDKIALFSNNMPNWNACYFAATTNGYVIVPMLPDFSPSEANVILEHSEAKALVVSDKLFSKVSDNMLRSMNVVIRACDLQILRYNVCEMTTNERPAPEIAPESLASIIYTSGTTSSPKGVMLSHKNMCSQLSMVLKLQDVVASDTFLSVLPLSHTYECTLGMLLPFKCGANVVYIDKLPTANVLIPILKEVRPTMMLTVPLIMEKIYKGKVMPQFTKNAGIKLLYKIPHFRKMFNRMAGKKLRETFGGRLRFFGIGGAKLDPKVERFLIEAKFPYAIGYGLTETAPLVAGVNPSLVKLQSTGKSLIGIELRIENQNPVTGEGEIVVKGDNVMMGYYKNPDATANVMTPDGWFKTSDLGVLDKEGNLYIKGRLNNMILGASGENIYPEEIEHVINGHSYVLESLVKEEKGKLVALVQFNREELEKKYDSMKGGLEMKMEQMKKDLLHYVNARVNKFSHVSTIVEHGSAFEKTATNKIKRFLYENKS